MSREREEPERQPASVEKGGAAQAEKVENKIFVGGLSQATTSARLQGHFEAFGEVEASVFVDRATGRSRGFGFCTFTSREAAKKALAEAHAVDGKQVECAACWAKPAAHGQIEAGRGEHKVFLGALSQATTAESLKSHFLRYGPCEATVMMDKATGRSRGFGFCTFASGEAVVAALSAPQVVDGRRVDCKVCSPKGEVQVPCRPNRLFVGGLPQTADESKLRDFFSRFGSVAEATIMVDKESGRSRGFGYVTLESPQCCELALANAASNFIDGKWVELKRCVAQAPPTRSGLHEELAQLSPQKLAQVAHLTGQLQSILGQPLAQGLQAQIAGSVKGGGKGRGASQPRRGAAGAKGQQRESREAAQRARASEQIQLQ